MPAGLSLQSPLVLMLAAAAAVVAAALMGRSAMPLPAKALTVICLLLLAAAAGGPVMTRRQPLRLMVMVDVSPSTRGAAWRHREWLERVVDRLRASGEVELFAFASEVEPLDLSDYSGADTPALLTRLPVPPSAEALLVLTDGRIEIHGGAGSITLAIDESLLAPPDAAVTRLGVDGDSLLAAAEWRGPGEADRTLRAGQVERPWRGASTLFRLPASEDQAIVARVLEPDAWPENNELRMGPALLAGARRAWVGQGSPPEGFEALPSVPHDPAALAGASVLVLANVAAEDVSPAAMQAIRSYVTDMGGTLLVLGGDRAFAAGSYAGTLLDDLSPLASVPPTPRARWILLADASGSMAEAANDRTRFGMAVEALGSVLRGLPGEARVDVGAFAASLDWWFRDLAAREAAGRALAPAGAAPRGPTNLASALGRLAAESGETSLPTQVITITDGQVPLDDVEALAQRLMRSRIVVNVVSIGGVAGDGLQSLVDATGGRLIHASDPSQWGDAARELTTTALGEPLVRPPATVRFTDELAAAGVRQLTPQLWNRTWLRADATPLTVASEPADGPRAAVWQVGLGRVAAISFDPPPEIAGTIGRHFEGMTDGGEAIVEWREGPDLVVRVRLPSGSGDAEVRVRRGEVDHPAQRVAPDQWEATIPAPRPEAVASVVVDGGVIERRATSSRYAPEFELEPTTFAATEARLEAAGHQVITLADLPDWGAPARLRRFDLTTPAALAGVVAGAAALIAWRRGMAVRQVRA